MARLLSAGVLLCVCASCINEDYSLKNLDTSVTVLPGLTVNPDQSFTLDFSGISNGSGNHDGIPSGGDGTFYLPGDAIGTGSLEIPGGDGPSRISFDGLAFSISRSTVLPLDIQDGDFNLHLPVCLEISNPTGITFQLSASLFAGSRRASVSGVAVVPGQSVVTLDTDDVRNLFCPFTDNVLIQDIVLTKPAGAVMPPSGGSFTMSAFAPLILMPGDNMSIRSGFELMDNMGIFDIEQALGFNITAFSAVLAVSNSIPLDFSFSIVQGAGGFEGELTADKKIAAGTPASPTLTELNIKVRTDRGSLCSSMGFVIEAVVPESFKSPVAISREGGIEVKVKSVTLDSGIPFIL